MNIKDCDVCLSAGSVNKWGICEICGEEFEETIISEWREITFRAVNSAGEQLMENEYSQEYSETSSVAVGHDAAA